MESYALEKINQYLNYTGPQLDFRVGNGAKKVLAQTQNVHCNGRHNSSPNVHINMCNT